MSDLLSLVTELRRPKLLIRAARAGVAGYNRNRDLKRVIRTGGMPAPEHALSELLAAEAEVEQTRQEGQASYSFTRHIELLIAMIGEAQLLPRRTAAGV